MLNLVALRLLLNLLLLVALPVALVSFAARHSSMSTGYTSAAAVQPPQAVSDTFAISISGNAVANATSPISLGTGILILRSTDNMYSLAINSSGSLLSGLTDTSGKFSQQGCGECPAQITITSTSIKPGIKYMQASQASMKAGTKTLNSLTGSVIIFYLQKTYAGFISGYQKN